MLVGGGFGVSLLFSADRNRVSGNVAEDVEQGAFVVTSSDNDVSANQLVRNAAGVVLGQQSNRNDVGIVVRAPLTILTANAANLNNGLGIDCNCRS